MRHQRRRRRVGAGGAPRNRRRPAVAEHLPIDSHRERARRGAQPHLRSASVRASEEGHDDGREDHDRNQGDEHERNEIGAELHRRAV